MVTKTLQLCFAFKKDMHLFKNQTTMPRKEDNSTLCLKKHKESLGNVITCLFSN